MALDPVDERASMLARCGSFWYMTVGERDREISRRLNGMACLTRIHRQLSNACSSTLSGGYFTDHYRVVRFSDGDIRYNGADEVLSARYAGCVDGDGGTVVEGVSVLTEDNGGKEPCALADSCGKVIVVPTGKEGDKMVLPASYKAEYGLVVDPDLLVQTVELDGRLLVNGIDFRASFGYMSLPGNPVAMFKGMKFMARSVVYRRRNLLCYTLGVDKVYGPVDRIMRYYRVSQSPEAFMYAAAQACGLAVTRSEGRVVRVLPLHDGASYIMDNGERYDAPYPHSGIQRGEVLPEGYVIGGRELLQMVLPGDDASDVPYVMTGEAFPVEVRVENKRIGRFCMWTREEGYGQYFRPVDLREDGLQPEDGNKAFNPLWPAMAEVDGGPSEWGDDTVLPALEDGYVNSIDWLRNDVCKGSCIIVRVNRGVMPYDMQVRLDNFIKREAPLGSILTYAPLGYTISERRP